MIALSIALSIPHVKDGSGNHSKNAGEADACTADNQEEPSEEKVRLW